MSITRLGAKVRLLRQHAGVSQAQLAQNLGLSQRSRGYISEIERGTKIPPADKVVLLARFFHVTTDVLLLDELDIDEDKQHNE